MDILKAFKLNDAEYEINIQGTHDEPLFQANQIGKLLGIKKISNSLKDFEQDEKVAHLVGTLGGMQNMTFLTEVGLYRLLGRSIKPIANIFQKWMINTIKEIRINGMYKLQEEKEVDRKLMEYDYEVKTHNRFIQDYNEKNVIYVFVLQKIGDKFIIKIGSTQSIKERTAHISNSFNLNQILLIEVVESDNYVKFENYLRKNEFMKNYLHPIKMKNTKMSTETYLVDKGQLEEFLKIIHNKHKYQKNDVKFEELKLKIEIAKGISENIILKQKELDSEKENKLLEIKKIEFEMYKYNVIVNNDESCINENVDDRYEEELKNKREELKNEREKNKNEREEIKNKIEEIKNKREEIKYESEENKNEIEKILNGREKTLNEIENRCSEIEKLLNEREEIFKNENLKMKTEIYKSEEESDDDLESETDINIATCNYTMKKRNSGKRSPKVYKYDVNDLTTPIHIYDGPMDVERALSNISPSSLKRSYENNTIYKDFRWFFVYINEVVPDTIPDTVISKQIQEVRMLAMIDIKKTKILEVFSTQKQAVEARNMKCNSFTRAIKQEGLSSGHYWKYFNDCSIEMKTEYLSHSKLPEKHIPSGGKAVEQIDPRTNEVIAKYYSNREIIKKFQMTAVSLKKASESGEIHNGYKWRIVV